MREFNLEEAKTGKPVCTRDGRPVRIICWDKKSDEGQFPIVALIGDEDNIEEPQAYKVNGLFFGEGVERELDLMMVSKRKEGWVNLYRCKCGLESGCLIYGDKEIAKACHDDYKDYFGVAKIEWEE